MATGLADEAKGKRLKPRPLLDTIKCPDDLKRLAPEQLPILAAEVREELLDVVAATGGHLASNLGMVELTIALLRVFDPPADKFVWDTGHQAYVYKLLTGRRQLFQSLRQDDGCCGFLHREESPYDVFGAGHAGTAISAATGMAVARDRKNSREHVIAVVGDGAIGCGPSLEGLNNVSEATRDMIIILNDNKMSIAPNVGALHRYLNRLISDEHYNRVKDMAAHAMDRIPLVGHRLRVGMRRMEEAAKSMLVPGLIFEELGLRYIGPLDGHDLNALIETLSNVEKLHQPLLVHVLTQKGRGYQHAEKSPELFHGLSRFDIASGKPVKNGSAGEVCFSDSFGKCLEKAMEQNQQIVAITAGMCGGTGLNGIRDKHPDRFHDVGIAEEHAVLFAAGMAAQGLQPVVAIYATFMQRAMDYVFHDVCLQNLPVIFALDRAGIVPDGPTHHGILDLAFWQTLPNLAILQPADEPEMNDMLKLLLEKRVPAMIRYPKADSAPLSRPCHTPLAWQKAEIVRQGKDAALWCLGRETATGLMVAEKLAEQGLDMAVVNTRFLKPFDAELLREQAGQMPIITLEDHALTGGLATLTDQLLAGRDHVRLLHKGWPQEEYIPWGSIAGIRRKYRMLPEQIVEDITRFMAATASNNIR